VLVDHYLLRQRRVAGTCPALRAPAVMAWVAGIALYHFLARYWPDVGATLPSLVMAGALHGGMSKVLSGVGAVPAESHR